ncbi:carbonic anhydrase [Kocuria sp. JC486]|uniref:carbonic anhydrase n=1 Tax=Kocuria soli TaxID=2485125 RepID=A0A3N3ZRS5_9MICC|nr:MULTISPECIES: carbonic anhydrase [Kocuria]NHU85332.1 carbonic anhydrase [Kocuria sp. JC486]ROZ63229.1 carbonic anhydrase [Kocuria soli]
MSQGANAQEPTNLHIAEDRTNRQLTPREAWDRLRAGNARFVDDSAQHPNQNASRRESLTQSQHPFATIFGCSDSRLAAEIIFDLGLGDAFVVRTAGQVIADAVLGTLEYSVEVLKVPLIVVLGHDSCGAVTATKNAVEDGNLPGGFQRSLIERITPAVLDSQRSHKHSVNDMVVENVRLVAERILDQSRTIAAAVSRGDVALVGMFYHLSDGQAELVYGHGSWLELDQ